MSLLSLLYYFTIFYLYGLIESRSASAHKFPIHSPEKPSAAVLEMQSKIAELKRKQQEEEQRLACAAENVRRQQADVDRLLKASKVRQPDGGAATSGCAHLLSRTGDQIDDTGSDMDITGPDWSSLPIERVDAYQIKLPSSMTVLKEMEDYDFIHEVAHRQTLHLKVAPKPFAKGRTRKVHKALEFSSGVASSSVPTIERPLIIKYAIKRADEEVFRRKYQESLSSQIAAIYLAQEFNKVVKPWGYPEIHFANVWLINHLERGAEGNPWGTMDEVMEGEWQTFNNNNGMVAMLPGIPHEVCQAFSHWTWHASDHDVMVVDIQGVYEKKHNRFFLTDPAIHCTDGSKFGRTNYAQKGMREFFKSHVCNGCCRALKLPAGPEQQPPPFWVGWIPAAVPPFPLLLCGVFLALSVALPILGWSALLRFTLFNIWYLFRLVWFLVRCMVWLSTKPLLLTFIAVVVALMWLIVQQRRHAAATLQRPSLYRQTSTDSSSSI